MLLETAVCETQYTIGMACPDAAQRRRGGVFTSRWKAQGFKWGNDMIAPAACLWVKGVPQLLMIRIEPIKIVVTWNTVFHMKFASFDQLLDTNVNH